MLNNIAKCLKPSSQANDMASMRPFTGRFNLRIEPGEIF